MARLRRIPWMLVGAVIVWAAITLDPLFSAITGTSPNGTDYTSGGRVLQGALAVGFFILGIAFLYGFRQIDREAKARAEEIRRRREDEQRVSDPPHIDYRIEDQ